jgi:hypothetical protein
MSAPLERLVSDLAAEHFECEALAVLASAAFLPSATESLAASVIALARDRQARIEIAAGGERVA